MARFHIAVRVREVRQGIGYRLFQWRKPNNRHLVDVRPIDAMPPTQRVADILVLTPFELVATKVIAYCRRQGTPKSFTDRGDIALLLLKFPELKTENGAVRDRLIAHGSDESIVSVWKTLVAEEIRPEADDEGY